MMHGHLINVENVFVCIILFNLITVKQNVGLIIQINLSLLINCIFLQMLQI
jgi:hypothetical protein